MMQRLIDANDGKSKFMQFYYPAAYACRLYEPEGENIDPQYAKGNWDLPSSGLLVRVYNFYHNSRARNTSKSVSSDYANELPETIARTPLYANLMKRAEDAGYGSSSISVRAATDYWSCTEYNSNYAWNLLFGSGFLNGGTFKYGAYRVRAVAAYHFEL